MPEKRGIFGAPMGTATFQVTLPSGKVVQQTLPSDSPDAMVRAAFASAMRKRGINSAKQVVQRPVTQPPRDTISDFDAPWRDDIAQTISGWAGKVGINERDAYRNTRNALGILDWVPGVGDVAGFADAGGSFQSGNYGTGLAQGALSTVGLIPGFGDAAAAGGKAALAAALAGSLKRVDRELPKIDFSGGYQKVRLGATDIEYMPKANGSVEISQVRTPVEARGQGSARAAMGHFISQADANKLRLELTADPLDKATSKSGLERFYRSLGFLPNKGRNKDFSTRAGMIREVP